MILLDDESETPAGEVSSSVWPPLTISSNLYHSCISEPLFLRLSCTVLAFLDTDFPLLLQDDTQHPAHRSMPPPKYDEDWSDSEDEDAPGGGVETAVQLGVPNGALAPAGDDGRDAAVSRIGGHPVRYVPSPHDESQDVEMHLLFSFPLLCGTLVIPPPAVWAPCATGYDDRR